MTEPRANSPERKDAHASGPAKYPTITQRLITGSIAGAVEVVVNHPLWSIKTRMQCGDPFSLNLRLLYRGILPNAASMIPITGLQVGLDRFFQQIFFKEVNTLTHTQGIISAFVAGVGSAPLCCGAEMILTHQKKIGGSFYNAATYLLTHCGGRSLFTGLPATMIREGVFTAFFLAGTPLLNLMVKPYFSNDYVASLLAGVGSGVSATLLSQGADTLKTIQQGGDPQQPISLQRVARELYAKQGGYGFFKGGMPRGARVTSAVIVMSFVTEHLETLFQQREAEEGRSELTKNTPKTT